MRPRTDRVCDRTAFDKLKRVWKVRAAAQRGDGAVETELPQEIAFKLTNRCNLRCKHCYQWGADGHHRALDREEQGRDLAFEHIERVFAATLETGSNVYFWGGEPLAYGDWDRLVALLARDRRWTTFCSNGLLVEERLPSLLPISDRIELYLSVDGLEDVNDPVRGRGTFQKIVAAVDRLLAEREAGRYLGAITIACVVTDALVGRVHEFVEFWERKGVDTVYVGLPWFLSAETVAEMDAYCRDHAPWRAAAHGDAGRPSWYSYAFGMSPDRREALVRDFDRLRSRAWSVAVRFNPEVGADEMEAFLSGSSRPAGGRSRCLSIHNRMDVMPNGDVVSCKFYPESVMGNLARDGVAGIWTGERFAVMRRTVERCGLMPVCSKCNLLYSRGV